MEQFISDITCSDCGKRMTFLGRVGHNCLAVKVGKLEVLDELEKAIDKERGEGDPDKWNTLRRLDEKIASMKSKLKNP